MIDHNSSEAKEIAALMLGEFYEPENGSTPDGENQNGSGSQPKGNGTEQQPKGETSKDPSGASNEEGRDNDASRESQLELPDDVDLDAILKHPKAGPLLQSWKDKDVAAADKAATERTRADLEAASSARQRNEEIEQLGEYFDGLDEEELAKVLAENPNAPKAYAAVQAYREQLNTNATAKEIADSGYAYMFSVMVATNNRLIQQADLSEDDKKALDVEHFKHLGSKAPIAWNVAVQQRLIGKAAESLIQDELETRWEAYKQEHLAEMETGRRRPVMTPGSSNSGAGIEMEKLDAEDRFAAAIEASEKRR